MTKKSKSRKAKTGKKKVTKQVAEKTTKNISKKSKKLKKKKVNESAKVTRKAAPKDGESFFSQGAKGQSDLKKHREEGAGTVVYECAAPDISHPITVQVGERYRPSANPKKENVREPINIKLIPKVSFKCTEAELELIQIHFEGNIKILKKTIVKDYMDKVTSHRMDAVAQVAKLKRLHARGIKRGDVMSGNKSLNEALFSPQDSEAIKIISDSDNLNKLKDLRNNAKGLGRSVVVDAADIRIRQLERSKIPVTA